MTPSSIEQVPFDAAAVKNWALLSPRHLNWPVVYVLEGKANPSPLVYVGESVSAAGRLLQHAASPQKAAMTSARIVVNETFNKSACLDLESFLIRLFAGDGKFQVTNRNEGITASDYYQRDFYQSTFREIFEHLRADGLFDRTIPEIQNSDLFKLSPFKALNADQAIVVEDILDGLLSDLEDGQDSTIVVQGHPGTGKTVVAVYLIKLLMDIAAFVPGEEADSDSVFSELFTEDNRDLVRQLRIGLVIPQQSLRKSIKTVFRKTPGLSEDMVLTPFEVGQAAGVFDLLVVDETHRLNQRANQSSGVRNAQFRDITIDLFGHDDKSRTQLDWIREKSRHQLLLLDSAQSVRPADLPAETLDDLVSAASTEHRLYRLATQMRVAAGSDYVGYVRALLSPSDPLGPEASQPDFGEYELLMFDDLAEMYDTIKIRDAQHGLSRLVAGYAWEWRTKGGAEFDIDVDGVRLPWNRTDVDWISSPTSLDEVGSIHTVQGYDLNYAGVIFGPDLRFDGGRKRLFVDRESYFDAKGKENNKALGKTYTDEDLLTFITNIYAVLMTRGIRGTFVYACDPALRQYLRQHLPV